MTSSGSTTQDWRTIAITHRANLDAQIPTEWRLTADFRASLPADGRLLQADPIRKSGILTEAELDVTENYSAAQLLQRLKWGDVSSVDVTRAFCKRAAVAGQLTNCLTEHFFPRALERAQYLDEYLKREGKVIGPLHGLPISLKDSFCLEGIPTTVGYVSFLKYGPAKENSALVNLLLDLGAVLYVKTNIPQTMMTADSENNIYGRTVNPHNTSLTAGGSTGGEGALQALRGSLLGVGTDIAGSVRIPALCCGVYGFKPTSNRVPFGGQISGYMAGIPGIEPSAGPLGQSIDDIELFMATVLSGETWRYDSSSASAPWGSSIPAEKSVEGRLLTIGILPEDPQYPLHPPVHRALTSAIDALRRKGHRLIQLPDPKTDNDTSTAYASRLAWQYFTYSPFINHMAPSGEPPITSVAKVASPLFTGELPISEEDIFKKLSALHLAKKDYSDFWRKTWAEYSLDVVLAPGAQNTAVPHDTYAWPPYTVMWNLVDYPAIIIPYGKASAKLDPETLILEDGVQPSYNPEVVNGAPCALQIVAPRFQDERCLSAARIIDRDIRL
ncbi:amidase signature domain-containing protein [Aspergillus keveii]|uniref:Amidase signature domain-containing protein n=1 Tax=Aspergillus keveii TaxID=714993 RepID=A0ABR4GQ38_9EURO